MPSSRAFALPAIVLLVAACAPVPAGDLAATVTSSSAVTPTATVILMPTSTPADAEPPRSPAQVDIPVVPPELGPVVTEVAADLAQRLAVPQEAITVVRAEAVVWPDAGLGCPQPGMAYAQVLVEGLQVVLEVDGQAYAYHGRSPDQMFLCGPTGPVPPGQLPAASDTRGSISTPVDQTQVIVDIVKADLAQQLGVPVDSIEVVSVTPQQWRTSGLGCEQPDQMYMQVITPGLQIVLAVGDGIYTYHTDLQGNFILCSQGAR